MELMNEYFKRYNRGRFNFNSMMLGLRLNEDTGCYEWYELPRPLELIGEYDWRYLKPKEYKAIIA